MDMAGDPLLYAMHSLSEDSLVYWLGFKQDEEFPSGAFGRISGGSGLKFENYWWN